MRFLPVAALVAIVWCNTSNKNWIEIQIGHSYTTLKQQCLKQIPHFTGFFDVCRNAFGNEVPFSLLVGVTESYA